MRAGYTGGGNGAEGRGHWKWGLSSRWLPPSVSGDKGGGGERGSGAILTPFDGLLVTVIYLSLATVLFYFIFKFDIGHSNFFSFLFFF